MISKKKQCIRAEDQSEIIQKIEQDEQGFGS